MPASSVAPLPLGSALVRSLTLALTTMVVSTVLGTITAQAFRRHFRGSGVVFYLVVLGMMVPGVLVGLGMALTANYIGLDRTWWSTVFLVHVVYTYPFAFLVMLAIFNRFDRSVEEGRLEPRRIAHHDLPSHHLSAYLPWRAQLHAVRVHAEL